MYQVSITIDRARLETVEQALLDHGAVSVTLRDAADQPVLEPLPGETPLWPRIIVIGLFDGKAELARLRRGLEGLLPDAGRLEAETVTHRDWTRAWMDDFKPMRFGRRLRVCPTGYEHPDPEMIDIRLDPGLAFGTGMHPTTALCLEWLDANAPVTREVIDYGCGSGILSLAAIKLGASRVRAVDIDIQARFATRRNAQRNGLSRRQIQTFHPDDLSGSPADVLLANILARPLSELAQRFASLLKPHGRIVLSGLLSGQSAALVTAYAPMFHLAQSRGRDGWALLEGARR